MNILKKLWRRVVFGPETMSAEELDQRVKQDATDEDIDRLLPPSLRKAIEDEDEEVEVEEDGS